MGPWGPARSVLNMRRPRGQSFKWHMNKSEAKEEELYCFKEKGVSKKRGFKEKQLSLGAETDREQPQRPSLPGRTCTCHGGPCHAGETQCWGSHHRTARLARGGPAMAPHLRSPCQKAGAHQHPRQPLHPSCGIPHSPRHPTEAGYPGVPVVCYPVCSSPLPPGPLNPPVCCPMATASRRLEPPQTHFLSSSLASRVTSLFFRVPPTASYPAPNLRLGMSYTEHTRHADLLPAPALAHL